MKAKSDSTSRFISLILRHKPEVIGITLDEHGWASVEDLIAGVNQTRPLDRAGLEEIVRTDEKQRYSFNADKTKIRANQGHSVPVDVEDGFPVFCRRAEQDEICVVRNGLFGKGEEASAHAEASVFGPDVRLLRLEERRAVRHTP